MNPAAPFVAGPPLNQAADYAEKRRTELRGMVEERIAPLVPEAEEHESFPLDVPKMLGEAGFLSVGAPVHDGGAGAGRTAESMVVEELTRASAGIAMSIMPYFIVRVGLSEFGTIQARDEVGEPMLRGERIVGISITEPDAGSDAGSLSTTATPDGTGFRLSGNKIFTTNGTIATDLLVAARVAGHTGIGGIGLFLVETDQPGYEASKLRKESCRSSDTAAVHFDGCYVPGHRVVGDAVGGFKSAMHVLNGERVISISRALALGESSWEDAVDHVQGRRQFGATIASFQQVQAPLAQAAAQLWLIRTALREVCRGWDAGEDMVAQIAMLKSFSAECAVDITRTCQHVMGARGLHRLSRVARNARDARLGPVGAGSVQVMHRILAKRFGFPVAVE
ncbi:MAG: hypothetical protein GEU94_01350 [Micromonosporaceae bacterium]|nr:hypothetical protein [Micromonosporaceae bacterium]